MSGFTGMEGEKEEGKEGDVAFELRLFVSDRWKVDEWETAWVSRRASLSIFYLSLTSSSFGLNSS